MNKTVSLKLVIIALISGIAVFIQVLPTFSENYHFSNDWLKKSNIYVFWNPPLDYLETVNATGTTWSVYYSGLNSYDLAYVDELHSNGFKVGSNFPTVQGNITNDQSLLESAHCIDLNGNPSTFFGGQYAMCYNNPTWQEFLKNRIKEHVDGKADAIHIDEIGSIGLDSGGGFCDYCMAAFNSYLSSHYSAEDLQQLFGIENINLFNYRTYLLGKGAQSVWDDPNPNLITEYLKSQYLSKAMKIQELIRYAQNYAGRAILFSGNPYGFRSNQQASIPYLDFVIFEMPIGSLPGGKHFTTYLLGEAMAPSKPFVGFPDIFDLASLSQDDWWLWRHWVAEAFACGASFLLPYRAYTYGGGEYTLFAEKIAPYTNFISTHSSYFKNVSRIAKVAVLHDLGSTLSNQVFWHAQFAWEDFLKTGLTLQEAHIPFEIIYKGDAEFVNKPITLSDLEKYSVVIVPSYYQLDNATENLLNQYLSEGGYVVRAENIPQGSNLIEEVRKTGANLGLETDASKDLSIIVYKKGDSLLLHLINYNYNYSTHDFIPQNQIKTHLQYLI